MGVFNLAEFEKLMGDVRQLTAIFEEVHAGAADCKEKQALSEIIATMKQATIDTAREVPKAAEIIENEARSAIAEGEAVQEELKKQMAKFEEMAAAYEKEEQERAASRPTPEELLGPVLPIDGAQLSQDMFQALHLEPPVDGQATKPSAPVKHDELWNWLKGKGG
jgi:hypothetical protein